MHGLRISSISSVMTTPCLKQTTSLHDSTNLRLNSWVFSHLDASIWSVSTASANNMGGMTDLGIAAFMRYCSIVLTFSSKWMMELKKETGVIWNPTYFNVIYWWITGGWTRSISLQIFFQFVFDDFCGSFNDALCFITSIVFCCHIIDCLLYNRPCSPSIQRSFFQTLQQRIYFLCTSPATFLLFS